MELYFLVGGAPAMFTRDQDTGRAEIDWNGETHVLQSPWNPLTHVGLGTRRTWERRLGGQQVVVAMERKRAFGGVRESAYAVHVDGELVAEATGT